MRSNLEKIDAYLNGEFSQTEKGEIERQIAEDKAFAKDFTIMLLSKKAAKDVADIERKKEFEALKSGIVLQENDNIFKKRNTKIWAVAASILLLFGLFFLFDGGKKQNLDQLAENYIKNKVSVLPVMMGTEDDSLQLAVQFYNRKSFNEAQKILEKLATKNPKALEYLGLSTLQLGNYDKARQIFGQLSINQTYNSRAKLLQALCFIKIGEKDKCFEILKTINKKDLSLDDREFIEDLAINN